MKSIFKLMTVAIAAGLAVSCSDDLNLEQKATLHVEKGDLVGTLYSESPTRVAMLDQQNSQGYPAVWSEDDTVNVFSPIRLNFNQYYLEQGAGTKTAVFEPKEEDPTLLEANDLYAITSAAFQYGVSKKNANKNDKDVLLTAEIPAHFDWEKVVADNGQEVDAYKMPTPWWGPASFGSEGELNVAFRPLTAVMRIDLADLPAGVNSIVLVTGNSTGVGAAYQVGAVDADGAPVANSEVDYTGTGEGISGTFNCILSLGNTTETALGVDRHLQCEDTLRVDLPEATEAKEDKVLFIPLIAQHYDKLQVIAVQADNVKPYIWYGEILRTYTDLVVNNGDLLNLSQTAQVTLTESSPLAISTAIAEMYDGKHGLVVSVPNIDFSSSDDNTLYIVSNPKKGAEGVAAGQTSVTINFPETLEEGNVNIAERNAIFTGDVPNSGAQFLRWGNDISKENFPADLNKNSNFAPKVKSLAKERTVRLNFNSQLANPVNVTLPTSNVEMTSGQPIKVNIISANTSDVSGYNFDQTYNAVSNEQNAALKFTGVYSIVNYAGDGAVYFLEEDSEIKQELNIFGAEPKGLRITDALINTISYPTLGAGTTHDVSGSSAPTNYIYTTGSAAIKWLNEPSDKIKIFAYWTSKRLTPYAVANGYEGTQVVDPDYNIGMTEAANFGTAGIYTAAQLQGMGLAESVYNYTISPKTRSIWLGGVTFPWIGAEIEKLATASASTTTTTTTPAAAGSTSTDPSSSSETETTWSYKYGSGQKITQAFSLDGRNVTLKNMILDIYDPNVVLPGCCGTTQKIRLTKNLGLIRTIRTKKTVDLFNIQLDDVLLDAHEWAIDNIGSLTGIIQAEDTVRIGGKELGQTVSNFTDIRIVSKGNQIGGIVGELETKAAPVFIDNVKVESIEDNNTYIHGSHIQGKNNVGGIAGRVTYDGAYDSPKDKPDVGTASYVNLDLYHQVTRGKNNVGKVFFDDGSLFYDLTANGKTYEDLTKEFNKLYYISDGDFVKNNQEDNFTTTSQIPTTVEYYRSTNDGYVKAGRLVLGVNELGYYSWTDKAENKHTATLTSAGKLLEGEVTYDLYKQDATDASGYSSATPTAADFSTAGNKFYVKETIENGKQVVSGGDYPTLLSVSKATVNLDKAAFDGKDKGIIKGEQGDNVGGMFGFAVINGPTMMYNGITVTVPTITATTKEVKNTKSSDKMPKYGNNAGGLIGTYYNVNTSKDPVISSEFAGTIKARKGIVAESSMAGGVLGQQTTIKINPTTDHSDAIQVYFGEQADLSVEIGDLKAVNGFAGGLVGYQEYGKIAVADDNKAVSVKIANLSGALCLGGLIGDQNDMAWIADNDNHKTVNVEITKVALTKTLDYFENTTDREYLGTIGTLVGEKNNWLYVNTSNVTTSIEGAAKLSDARKEALLFKYCSSAATTEAPQAGQYFWGDTNGYVGVAKETSMYFAPEAVQGNYRFNIYMAY